MNQIKLSIVVPSYNESEDLKKKAIDQMAEFLKEVDFSYEVVIVDDESTNGTVGVVEKYIKDKKNFRLLRNKHGGKAITVMTGMLEAKGEIALFTDMDQATPLSEIDKFIPKFEEGFDVVIGIRKGRKGAPLRRKFVAWGFALLRNILLGLPFPDTQCGFKAFAKNSREEIFKPMIGEWKKLTTKGAAVNAGFDVETLFIAKKKGFKIATVEVNWHHVEVGSRQVRIINEAFGALKDMLRIRFNDLSGKYQ